MAPTDLNEFQKKEHKEQWQATRKDLLEKRAALAAEMRKTLILFECPAKHEKDCPLRLPEFKYDFKKKGYPFTIRASEKSPWSLGNGLPSISNKKRSVVLSTGKHGTGLFVGGHEIEVEGRRNAPFFQTENRSTMTLFWPLSEEAAKDKAYGRNTKIRFRLLLQLQSAGYNNACRTDIERGKRVVTNDGLGVILGTKLRGYQLYVDSKMIAEKVVGGPAPTAASATAEPPSSASASATAVGPAPPDVNAKGIPAIPAGRSPRPTDSEWRAGVAVNTQGAGTRAHGCSVKIVRESIRVHCDGDIKSISNKEGLPTSGSEYFQSITPGKQADFVFRLKKGRTTTLRIHRDGNRASLFISWPASKDRPVQIALAQIPESGP